LTDSAAPSNAQLDACFQAIEDQCASRGLAATRLDDAVSGWVGVRLQGALRYWDLYVDCAETELKLPRVWLGAPRGLLAHVSYGGTVCVNDGQGLSIDPDRHEDIAAYTLLAGFDLLEKWGTGTPACSQEFFNELEGYWSWLPGALRGRASFEVDGVDRLVTGYVNSKRKPPTWFFVERGQAAPPEFNVDKLAAQRALYVHIDEFPDPPAHPDKLTPAFVEAVLARFSPRQMDLWGSLVGPSKNGPKQVTLLVSCPRHAGGRSLVGFVFGANKGVIDLRVEVVPVTVHRHTASYMRERGGASLDLMGKHVVVLGCGAVGSVVADALAAAGVGRLTLVDHDDFSEDNVFRHVLEPMYIGIPKPIGLQFQFQRKYPGIQVTPVNTTAQAWLRSADLAKLDGIVLAFGAPSVERSFSRALKDKKHQFPVVFTWLEALDLGGHSILMWTKGDGCLDCIYRDEEGMPVLYPRTSFLEPNQHVTRNLTGCGSTFVPYGALQSRRTGLMAAEHLLSSWSGEPAPSYRYWVGDGSVAAGAGLKTTHWWTVANQATQMDASSRVFGRPCKRCRGAA